MRSLRRNAVLFSALLLSSGPGALYAADSGKSAGTTTAQFLELPVGAREIAMGSAGGAVSGDATVLYYNPAGLAGVQETSIALMQAFYFQDVSYQFGAVAGRLDGKTGYALGVQRLSPGAIDEIDNTGIPTGSSLHPEDLAVTAGLGRKFGALDIGLAGKYISSRIDESAAAGALDAGLRLRLSPDVVLAGSLANIGTGLKYREVADALPASARLGASVRHNDFLYAADLVVPKSAQAYVAAGAEYCAYNGENVRFLLRAGYNGRTLASKLGGLTGFSAGAGFDIGRFFLDYAFTPFGDLGDSHRISIALKFGDRYAADSGYKPAAAKAPAAPRFVPGNMVSVAAAEVGLRTSPAAAAQVIALLTYGTEVKVIEQRGDWVNVTVPSGKTGWLYQAVLKK